MDRPSSIVTFERLYLASFVLGLIASGLGWSRRQAMITANPALAPGAAWMLPAMAILGAVITLLLWYFIARRGSVIAKWIMVAFTAILTLGGIGTLLALIGGRSFDVRVSVISLVDVALSIAAAAMLFRPDARPWFGEPDLEESEVEA